MANLDGCNDGSQTLRRGLAILKLLAAYPTEGLSISDIARRLMLSKTTAIRLARSLLAEKFLVQLTATRRYRLGPQSFAIGIAAEGNYPFHRIAAPFMQALAEDSGDFVFFAVKDELDAVCVSKASSPASGLQGALRVGDRHPLGLGTAGLAMLSQLPDSTVDSVVAQNSGRYMAFAQGLTGDGVHKQVHETRSRGYSYVPGTLSPGYWGIGVPLISEPFNPVAAVILVSTTNKLTDSRRNYLAERMLALGTEIISLASLGR